MIEPCKIAYSVRGGVTGTPKTLNEQLDNFLGNSTNKIIPSVINYSIIYPHAGKGIINNIWKGYSYSGPTAHGRIII